MPTPPQQGWVSVRATEPLYNQLPEQGQDTYPPTTEAMRGVRRCAQSANQERVPGSIC